MNLRTKFMGIGGVIVAAALVTAPVVGHAQNVGVIAFTGATNSVTCGPIAGVVPAVGCPTGQGIPYVGGQGNYAFSTGSFRGLVTLCDEVTNAGVSGCTITSNGSYTNVVCGTGLALGSAQVSGNPSVSVPLYGIVFVAGVGVLAGETSPLGATAGVVDITPADTGNPTGLGPCVFNFDVLAATVAAVS